MGYLESYCTDILDGKIIACDKLKTFSETLLYNAQNPGKYHYDPTISQRHIDFIQLFCCDPEGGKKLILQPFQLALLDAIFGFVDDLELRQYHECFLLVGRKNGKTTLCSALELDMLLNDGEGAPQIYNVATAKDQARLGFQAVQKMIKKSPMLTKHLKKRASDIYFPANQGIIKPLASDTNKLDGLNTSFAVIDELAAIKNRDLYDLIKQSGSSRKQPLLFTITTNGFIRGGIFDSQYNYAAGVIDGSIDDDTFLPWIYELDDRHEINKEASWIKANPGLGTIKRTEALRGYVNKAQQDPSYMPTVLVKDFNLPQTESAAWLRYEDFEHCEQDWDPSDPAFRYGVAGFDASDSVDLTAAKVLTMKKDDPRIYMLSMYWIPESVLEQEEKTGSRKGRDNVPYRLWADQGFLRVCPGNRIDKRCILEWFDEVRDEYDIYISYVGYDRWHVDDTLQRELEDQYGKENAIQVRQGVQTMSGPLKNLKADLQAGRLIYAPNPIDKWQFFNAVVKPDINGNIQLVKNAERAKRNDGMSALADSYTVLENNKDDFLAML